VCVSLSLGMWGSGHVRGARLLRPSFLARAACDDAVDAS
jgi:hypothetical protein